MRYHLPISLLSWTLLSFAVATIALGQESRRPVSITIGGGYETGSPKMNFDTVAMYSIYAKGSSTGRSWYGGIQLPGLFGDRVGLRTGVRWSRYDALFMSDELPDVQVLLPDFPVPVNVTVRGQLDFSVESIEVELLGHSDLFGIEADLGAVIGRQRISNVLVTQRLDQPLNARFMNNGGLEELDNGRTLVQDRGGQLSQQPVALGVLAGISYPIYLWGGIAIVPGIHLRWELLSPARNTRYADAIFGAGLSLRYSFPIPEVHDTSAPVEKSPPSLLTASIDLYSVGDDGGRMPYALFRSGAVHHHDELRTAPEIFFDRDSTAIPARYQHPADLLSRLDPAIISAALPDLIGSWLRADSAGTIRLLPLSAKGEPAGLGRKRAEAIRDYLVGRWGWNEKRIAIAADRRLPDGDPAVIVELPAGTTLAADRDETSGGITPIRVAPSFTAEAGARRWDLTFTQNDRLLAHSTSDDAADSSVDLDMLLRDVGMAGNPAPLIVKLTVQDSAGSRVSARKELPFLPDTLAGRITSLLFLPVAGSPDPVGDWRTSLDAIAVGHRGGVISVAGLGAGGTANARRVADLLRGKGMTVREATEMAAERRMDGGISITIEDAGRPGR
ncbi:MAG: hypothetical protein ABIQ57_18020 [Candidatus Kapaibacterium sp.]